MGETEDRVTSTQIPRLGITDGRRWFYVERGLLPQCPVWPVAVVMDHVLGQELFQMSVAEDQHPVEALTTNRPDEPLGEGIGSRCSHRGADDPDAVSSEDLVEARGELGVPVADEEPDGMDPIDQCQGQSFAYWTTRDPVG